MACIGVVALPGGGVVVDRAAAGRERHAVADEVHGVEVVGGVDRHVPHPLEPVSEPKPLRLKCTGEKLGIGREVERPIGQTEGTALVVGE
mgnify:CR=1 FL=1